MNNNSERIAYNNMRQRCENQRHPSYHRYGGRGITVCDRWKESFDNFYEDMGPKPSQNYSIDRIDTFGNYEPDNCRWATWEEQSVTRRPSDLLLDADPWTKEVKLKLKAEFFKKKYSNWEVYKGNKYIKLLIQGYSQPEIAKMTGTTKQAVSYFVKTQLVKDPRYKNYCVYGHRKTITENRERCTFCDSLRGASKTFKAQQKLIKKAAENPDHLDLQLFTEIKINRIPVSQLTDKYNLSAAEISTRVRKLMKKAKKEFKNEYFRTM